MSQPDNTVESVPGEEQSSSNKSVQEIPDNGEFPLSVLKHLEEQVLCRSRWVVPVLPGGELEVLMLAAIKLAKEGRDEENELCRRFYKEAMAQSYYKILVDEASSQWRHEIHVAIYNSCKLLMELIALKMNSDSAHLLHLLQFAFNPSVRFHVHNANEKSNTCQQPNDVLLYAKPPSEGRPPKGWLVDLINWFGEFGGFERLLQRFISVSSAISAAKQQQTQQSRHNSGSSDRLSPNSNPQSVTACPNGDSNQLRPLSASRQQSTSAVGDLLSIQIISALLKPFSCCHEFLMPSTVQTYFVPIRDHLFEFFDSLNDQQIQKFSSTTPRSDGRMGESIGSILRYLRLLLLELPEAEQIVTGLEDLRLRLIMRQLHSATFSTKMAGLAELNRLATSQEQDDFPAVQRLTDLLNEGKVLPLLLRDFLHLPQYTERVEKLLRFMIRHKAIGAAELDLIWSVQTDQHEAIVKNVHDLLARVAWDFSPEQLDHFFGLIAKAWPSASRRQQEQLLVLLKRLSEDDRDGQTAQQVLKSLWTMVREPAVSVLVLEQALACHAAVLETCLMSKRDQVRMEWLIIFIEDIRRDPISLAVPELRQILAIIETWPQNSDMRQRMNANMGGESSRVEVIHRLRERYSIFDLLIDNLGEYMKYVRQTYGASLCPDTMADNRYDHITQIKERLKLIRFLLQEGDVWLSDMHATKIWQTLAVGWVHSIDRDICFKWFSKLVANGPDMDPSTIGPFFMSQFLQLDPCLMTENGVACFRAFFHHANKEPPHQSTQTQSQTGVHHEAADEPLIGIDYLWRMVLQADDSAADSAAILLRETLSEIALPLNISCGADINGSNSVEMVAENFVERFRVASDSARPLIMEAESDRQRRIAISRLLRVLTLIRAVIATTDAAFTGIRLNHPPLWRLCIGKQMRIRLRFSTGQNASNSTADESIYDTNSHEQVASLRQWAAAKLGVHSVQLLRPGSAPLIQQDYARVFEDAGITDGSLLIARAVPVSATTGASMGLELNDADSSDAECTGPGADSGTESGALNNGIENPSAMNTSGHGSHASSHLLPDESCLLSVQLARSTGFISMLLDVADWAPSSIRSATLLLLNSLPANPEALVRIANTVDMSEFFSNHSKTPVASFYNLKLMHASLCPVRGQPETNFMERFIRTAVPALHRLVLTEKDWNADVLAQVLSLLNATCGLVAVAGIMAINQQVPYASQHFPDHERQLQAILRICPPLCFNSAPNWGEFLLKRFQNKLPLNLVDNEQEDLLIAIRDMSWATLFTSNPKPHTFHRQAFDSNSPDFSMPVNEESASFINEAVRTISCLVLLNPQRSKTILNDPSFQQFFVDLLLVCPQSIVRQTAATSLYSLCENVECWHFLIVLLFNTLNQPMLPVHQERSYDFCDLVCRLLSLPSSPNFVPGYWRNLLVGRWQAIAAMSTFSMSNFRDNQLAICAHLSTMLTPEEKSLVASDNQGPRVLRSLLEEFVFAPSLFLMNKTGNLNAISSLSSSTVDCALNFAGRLSENSLPNLQYAARMVLECMDADSESLPTNEWECAPAIGPRPAHGYVGLKNAGATCYMNSVLQQLFMLEPIRDAILTVSDSLVPSVESDREQSKTSTGVANQISPVTSGENYNKIILSDLRTTFAFLLMADAQFYNPLDLQRHLRLGGEAVNVREQHDALEFLHSLGDAVDEAMRGSMPQGVAPIIERTLGGTFADLKICRDCPHRYSREETFTTISVDVHNHRNLHESLEQYVRPDLLDGQNAYYCEQCQAKVTAIKRMCVRNLPPILVLQLKRFDFDWERDCATKFNDYFEFPRQLDMEPYTEAGIARRDTESPPSHTNSSGTSSPSVNGVDSALYNLIGVVVHSGQASGGHYYSFIKRKCDQKWFRFDDCDVTEASLDDDIELRNQCFGGETDPVVSAASGSMSRGMRRHRNYWNAYLLFYERVEPGSGLAQKVERLSMAELPRREKSPPPAIISAVSPKLMQSVNEWNALAGHRRLHFSPGYFTFCKQLMEACCNFLPCDTPEASAAARCGLVLSRRHLFELALRVRRQIRGNASDLTEICAKLLQRAMPEDRRDFLLNTGLLQPARIWDYVVDCQSVEVRAAISRLLTIFIDCSINDPKLGEESSKYIEKFTQTVHEYALNGHSPGFLLAAACIAQMKRRDFVDYARHTGPLLAICCDVASFERRKLAIDLQFPQILMNLLLDDTFSSTARHHQAELAPVCQALSTLLRSLDFSPLRRSRGGEVLATNPYADQFNFGPAPNQILDQVMMFGKQPSQGSNFPRRLINWLQSSSEDATKLLQFLCWENWSFSAAAISISISTMVSVGVSDCALYANLIINLMSIQDSWQSNRLEFLLKAGAGPSDSLPSVVERLRQQQPRRAYLILKVLVTLMTKLPVARQVLAGDSAASRAFVATVEWLKNQLVESADVDPVPPVWSGPLSNESSGGYFLEHSQSARRVLSQATQLLPELNVSAVAAEASPAYSVPSFAAVTTPLNVPISVEMTGPDDPPLLSPPIPNPLKRSPPIISDPSLRRGNTSASSSEEDERPSSPKLGSPMN